MTNDSKSKAPASGSLPNFLVLGSAKCATSSLHFYLNQHPDIFMTKKKECHFFCHQDIPKHLYESKYQPIDSIQQYHELFQDGRHHLVRGESSPMYLFYEQTAQRIQDQIPDGKFVAVLRNPADRAFSAYLHAVRDGLEDLPYLPAMDAEAGRMASGEYSPTHAYGEFGYYFQKLKPYFDLFDRDQIRVFAYEDLKDDMEKTLRECCEFLGVDSRFGFDTKPRLNVSGVPKRKWVQRLATAAADDHWPFNWIKRPIPQNLWIRMVKSCQYANYEKPKFSDADRDETMKRYRDDIECLSDLVGRDFTGLWDSAKAKTSQAC